MSRKFTSAETKSLDNTHITYYFTVLFTVLGAIAVFYILFPLVEGLNLFIIMLATCGGGIPIGCIGMLIDYKVSKLRVEKRSFR